MNTSAIPSHFAAPCVTTIPSSRFDSRGRQLGFKESEVQRLERLAFANASNSPRGSPTETPTSSSSGSPISTRKMFISEPFNDPIELLANQLASELFETDDFLSLYEEGMEVPDFISPRQHRGHSPASSLSHLTGAPSSGKVSNSPLHTRKKSPLSLIPEED